MPIPTTRPKAETDHLFQTGREDSTAGGVHILQGPPTVIAGCPGNPSPFHVK
jgi:hypothetical protein